MSASYDYDSDCSAFCDGSITFSANTSNYGYYTTAGLTLVTPGISTSLKYTYDNYEEKDSLWKTEQNFTDEEWENFCAEEQLEDEDINYNW